MYFDKDTILEIGNSLKPLTEVYMISFQNKSQATSHGIISVQ